MVTPKRTFMQRIFRLADTAGDTQSVENAGETGGQQPIVRKTIELGTTGTVVNSGYPREEYLPSLQGRARADVFDEMRRSDPQVVMLLAAVKNPIKSATWEIEPGAAKGEQPSQEAIDDAKLIEHILMNDSDKPFPKLLSEILTFIEFGHSVFEVTMKVVIDHPRFKSYNGIRSLGFRSQRTIDRWNMNKETGKLASVTQIVQGDLSKPGTQITIPDQFLLTFSVNQEGSNYEGISMLRPCFGPWSRKDLYMKLNAIGIEKYAVGTPLAKIPEGLPADSEQVANMIEALEKYQSHEANYLMFPAGWELDLNNNTYDPSKVEESIDKEDKRMTKAFLANFLELGMSGGGAYALSNDLSDFMLSSLEHIAAEVEGPINQDLIPSLVQLNRGPREFYPRLKHSGISDKAGSELGSLLKTLGDGKWLTPEDADEDQLRQRLGLPARTGAGARKTENIPAPPTTLSERIKLAELARLKGSRG